MQFIESSWLWLLWLVPPLAGLFALAASRRRAAMGRFAEERFARHLVPTRSPGRSALRVGLLAGGLLLMVFSMAGPSWGFSWEKVERRGVDVVIALDLSRSMLAEDVSPDRLTAAKREIKDLLELLQGDRVGLVVFAGSAFIQVPLTLDYNTFSVFLDQLDPNWVPIGGTDLGAAVRTSIDTFVAEERSSRAVILITDGEDHGGELEDAAQEAKQQGVHVFVVGVGSPEGVPIPDGEGGFIKERSRVVLSKLDEPALKQLALTTGGSYVRSVSGVADLEQIYLEDIKTLLEARSLSSSRQRRSEERYQWFLLPAFLLLFAEPLFGPRRRSIGAQRPKEAPGGTGTAALVGLLLAVGLVATPGAARAGWFDEDAVRAGYEAYDDGDYSGALGSWLNAQTDDPDNRELDYNIGHAHFRLGDFPAAEQAFQAAAAGSDRELAADALYNAGNALFEQGRYLDAMSAYDASLEIRPDDEDAIVNRDLAQRRYEELLEQAQQQQDQEQEQEQEEQPQDQETAENENPQQGEEGEDGEEQQEKPEQQQGQGMSEDEPPTPPEESGQGERDDQGEEDQEQPEGADDGQAEEQPEEMLGGAAEAADIDRERPEEDSSPVDGEIAHETEPDPAADDRPAQVVEGALTEEEAEALLQALEADQAARRAERTRREAARGRRAAAKDW
jgi:Ca-activated chloride channel homolog